MRALLRRMARACFNPTLVRLRPRFGRLEVVEVYGFNPTLVRLRRRIVLPDGTAFYGFNPTLVRLRPAGGGKRIARYLRFQSHAGSIETDMPPDGIGRSNTGFQSHAGSIEAPLPQCPGLVEWCFNPTLVRLRPKFRRLRQGWPLKFQSHAGSIEAGCPTAGQARAIPGFNPTLVRLRPAH